MEKTRHFTAFYWTSPLREVLSGGVKGVNGGVSTFTGHKEDEK